MIIHDLKEDRQNVSSGLPSALKIVPVAFYLGSVFSVLLSLFFYLSFKTYESTDRQLKQRLSEAETEKKGFENKEKEIINVTKNAEGLAKWLEGARPLQPVTAAIGRSMAKDSTIAELSLNRNPEIPAHTHMQLKINGGAGPQVESTLNSIYSLNYQTYSAQQVKGRNVTDFQATLIYSDR